MQNVFDAHGVPNARRQRRAREQSVESDETEFEDDVVRRASEGNVGDHDCPMKILDIPCMFSVL